MGVICFQPRTLVDSLSETAGYKTGLALSFQNLCDIFFDSGYADLIIDSEQKNVVIRSEDYEQLFYKLLYRIGFTNDEFNGDRTGIKLFHKYKDTDKEKVYLRVLELFVDHYPTMMNEAINNKTKLIDPTSFISACFDEYGNDGSTIAMEKLEAINNGISLSPHSITRYTEWKNIEQLDSLFTGSNDAPKHGGFIDQRFINYLHANPEKLANIHWRRLEQLTAEFFDRQGYNVELGPGRNDDGVDVRIWKKGVSCSETPHCIIQCKCNQSKKVEKIVVKGLYADLLFEKAECGLLVTTTELSLGARKNISARGYPIEEINKAQLEKWLNALHVPGSGIVRV